MAPSQSALGLRHYLQVLWRSKLIILEVVVIIPLVVFFATSTQTKMYTATARVIVENQQLTLSTATGQDIGYQAPDDRSIATLASFVTTSSILGKVVALGWNDSTGDLAKHVKAVPSTDSNVIDVNATWTTPQGAANLANAVAGQFVDWRKTSQQAALEAALTLVDQQLATTSKTSIVYQTLLDRRSQLEVTKALTSGGVSLGEPAQPPTAPSSPRPKRDAALAFAGALVLGVALAFVRDALDVKIHSVDELQQYTDIPVIGTIPDLPKEYRRNGKLISLEDKRGSGSEAYRFLRTNLEFVNFNHDIKTILVTSPLPSQGKSTTIANLAVVLLWSGKKVAMVEGDLRRPAMHRFFQIHNALGLTSVVSGAATLAEATSVLTFQDDAPAITTATGREALADARQTTAGMRHLSVLPSGPLPPNPGEMLGSEQLGQVLDDLRESNDYVLVDTPPIFVVGDAAALASRVDGVIIVLRLDETTRDQLREVETFAKRLPGRTLGFVVTGVSTAARGGHYKYGEYYK